VKYWRWLLAPITPLYWLIIYIRNWTFDRRYRHIKEVSVPVISVGNLTTGGTGKTPVTIYLVETMGKAGIHVNIISRGYGGRQDYGPMIVNPNSDPIQSGDEPLMMAKRLGPNRVIVGHKRYHAANLALSLNPQPNILIMDDGFQHRGLKRDIDILLLDGISCCGNGLMLPIGNLREPMSSASRASCLVVTRSNKADRNKIMAWWNRWGSGGPIFWLDFVICALRRLGSTERIEINKSYDITDSFFAFCAIGHPEAFFSDLETVGLSLSGTKSFIDHKFLTSNDLQQLQAMAIDTGARGLVCTEKDAVKINTTKPLAIPVWIAEQQVVSGELLLSWLLQQITTY
jgi:tetraacyldisaccharide 4'-kinase